MDQKMEGLYRDAERKKREAAARGDHGEVRRIDELQREMLRAAEPGAAEPIVDGVRTV